MVSVSGYTRASLPTVALVAPALACLVAAAAILVAAVTVGYRPMAAPRDVTLPEAAALRDRAEILRQIRAGADPNRPARVRPGFVRGTEYVLTPLQAAVAARRLDVVEILVTQGAAINMRNMPGLLCFAERVGAVNVLAYLRARQSTIVNCEGVILPW